MSMLLTYLPASKHLEIKKIISSFTNETTAITLLAICILMNLYLEDRDEWKMIEKKARKFVKSQGVKDTCSSQFDAIFKSVKERE